MSEKLRTIKIGEKDYKATPLKISECRKAQRIGQELTRLMVAGQIDQAAQDALVDEALAIIRASLGRAQEPPTLDELLNALDYDDVSKIFLQLVDLSTPALIAPTPAGRVQ